jgi:hypothetical protein
LGRAVGAVSGQALFSAGGIAAAGAVSAVLVGVAALLVLHVDDPAGEPVASETTPLK